MDNKLVSICAPVMQGQDILLGTRYPSIARLTSSNDPANEIRLCDPCLEISGACLIVDRKLVLQDLQPLFIDRLRLRTLILRPRINRTPLSIPHAQPMLVHPLPLLLIASPQPRPLYITAHIFLWTRREPKQRIVMDRISHILPALIRVPKVAEVRREGVPIEIDRMVRVDRPNSLVDPMVEVDQAGMRRVGGFVHRIISRDPRVADVVFRELLPEPDRSVLEVLVHPEVGDVRAGVRVPVGVLATGTGVQVENGVDSVFGADVDDTVEVLEAAGLEYTRVHVVYEACKWYVSFGYTKYQ